MHINNRLEFCLLGQNIKRSLSPDIYNFWFKKYKINALYELEEINLNSFDSRINYIFSNYDGFNITSPFKGRMVKFLKTVKGKAKKIHIINCVKNDVGFNTDIAGFEKAVNLLNINFYKYKKILILGSGGAALSLAYSLKNYAVPKEIYSRSHITNNNFFKLNFSPIKKFNYNQKESIIINCTNIINFLREKIECGMYLDLNYCQGKNNEDFFAKLMLLYQAQRAFYCWFNFYPYICKELKQIVGVI